MKKCPKCNTENPDEANFCRNCGGSVFANGSLQATPKINWYKWLIKKLIPKTPVSSTNSQGLYEVLIHAAMNGKDEYERKNAIKKLVELFPTSTGTHEVLEYTAKKGKDEYERKYAIKKLIQINSLKKNKK